MTDQENFTQQIDDLLGEVRQLDDAADAGHIEETANRLAGLNYSPPIITPLDKFLRMQNRQILAEIDRILDMPEEQACALAVDDSKKCAELRLQYITVLVFYYKKLLELRRGNPEAWDEIDELYVHD